MIQMLRKRLDKKEEGFTLIELMVVVLIIAILLAIAIPTFLGARSRAQNRSAESNLRNALTAEKTAYTDAQTYVSNTASLQSIEPSLTFLAIATSEPVTGNNVMVVTDAAADTVCLGSTSASGSSYWMLDNGSGTFYTSTGVGGFAEPTAATCTASPGAQWQATTTAAKW